MTDGEKLNYLAVKSLSKLLRETISKNNSDYYCFNCLQTFRTANKLKSHEGSCKDYDYCHVKMPETHNNILKLDHEYCLLSVWKQYPYSKKYPHVIKIHKNPIKQK